MSVVLLFNAEVCASTCATLATYNAKVAPFPVVALKKGALDAHLQSVFGKEPAADPAPIPPTLLGLDERALKHKLMTLYRASALIFAATQQGDFIKPDLLIAQYLNDRINSELEISAAEPKAWVTMSARSEMILQIYQMMAREIAISGFFGDGDATTAQNQISTLARSIFKRISELDTFGSELNLARLRVEGRKTAQDAVNVFFNSTTVRATPRTRDQAVDYIWQIFNAQDTAGIIFWCIDAPGFALYPPSTRFIPSVIADAKAQLMEILNPRPGQEDKNFEATLRMPRTWIKYYRRALNSDAPIKIAVAKAAAVVPPKTMAVKQRPWREQYLLVNNFFNGNGLTGGSLQTIFEQNEAWAKDVNLGQLRELLDLLKQNQVGPHDIKALVPEVLRASQHMGKINAALAAEKESSPFLSAKEPLLKAITEYGK